MGDADPPCLKKPKENGRRMRLVKMSGVRTGSPIDRRDLANRRGTGEGMLSASEMDLTERRRAGVGDGGGSWIGSVADGRDFTGRGVRGEGS